MSKHSVDHQPVCFSARTLNWPGFPSAFDTSTAAYHPKPTSLRNIVLRLNRSIFWPPNYVALNPNSTGSAKISRLEQSAKQPPESGSGESHRICRSKLGSLQGGVPSKVGRISRWPRTQSWPYQIGKPLITCQVFPLQQRTSSYQRLNLHYEADRILQISIGGQGLLTTVPTTCTRSGFATGEIKGVPGKDDIPPSFIKAVVPRAKSEVLAVFFRNLTTTLVKGHLSATAERR